MIEALNKYNGNVPNTEFEKLLLSLASQEKDKDKILDVMFDYFDAMMLDSRWSHIDLFLARVNIEKATLTYLIGLLTITFPASKGSKMDYRNEVFYPRIKKMLESRQIDPETYLIGLK
jgi:hypothetical protein